MDLQHSPNRWSCLPTAFAMVLGKSLIELVHEIGHDGSEVIWPDSPDPYCRRGFHVQELINVLYHYGLTATPFEACPCSISKGSVSPYSVPLDPKRLEYIMTETHGVITGTTLDGQPHAVAWNGSKIFDPNGTKYGLEKFILETYWLIRP